MKKVSGILMNMVLYYLKNGEKDGMKEKHKKEAVDVLIQAAGSINDTDFAKNRILKYLMGGKKKRPRKRMYREQSIQWLKELVWDKQGKVKLYMVEPNKTEENKVEQVEIVEDDDWDVPMRNNIQPICNIIVPTLESLIEGINDEQGLSTYEEKQLITMLVEQSSSAEIGIVSWLKIENAARRYLGSDGADRLKQIHAYKKSA